MNVDCSKHQTFPKCLDTSSLDGVGLDGGWGVEWINRKSLCAFTQEIQF